MRFPKLALFAALLSPVLFSPAYARGGGGGFRGGGGGGFRGGGGGFRGGFYGGRFYGGGGVYLGLGGWGYPYGYYGYPYYGYDPYYSYDPYAYGGYTYSAPVQTQPQQVQPQPQRQPQAQPQSSSASSQRQNYYLIAFNDHAIHAATAYKVDGDQIHWIGLDGKEQQAPLSTVDVQFSQQLNRDRGISFPIP